MNVQLVENLAKVIESLNPEERTLLEKKLERKPNWQVTMKQIDELQAKIRARRGGNPIEGSEIDEIFYQMREERSEQLMQACLEYQ